jgi:hypothetical protein
MLISGVCDAMQDSPEVPVEDDGYENADSGACTHARYRAATGSSTEIVVPAPGGLTIAKCPASASTRSLRPVKPDPAPILAPPTPSSVTVARIAPESRATLT